VVEIEKRFWNNQFIFLLLEEIKCFKVCADENFICQMQNVSSVFDTNARRKCFQRVSGLTISCFDDFQLFTEPKTRMISDTKPHDES